jgi:serine phosphatase RsbU (regulator of sigma subunit)
MTTAVLQSAGLPLLNQLFPPSPLIEEVQRTPTLIFGTLECCLAVAFLALWRAARDYRVFSILGFFYVIVGAGQFLQYFAGLNPLVWTLRALSAAILVEAAGDAMQVPRRGWTKLFWPIYLFAAISSWVPGMAFANDLPPAISEVALGVLIAYGFRFGNRRDRMVAAAFSADFVVRLSISSSFQRLTGIKNYALIGGWQWQYTSFTLTLLGAVTLAILVRDLIRDRREKQRMAAELAAGRAVQQVLIPEGIPTFPGFSIQSVYKPFGEVGGDFFQVLPAESNRRAAGVLVMIGDVSGKGLPAAMTVAMLVGTARALAHYGLGPGEILAAMNQHLLARSNGGFTTCLVMRADTDGKLTIANAGHVSPYRNGAELQLENGLPLGLAQSAIYNESTCRLAENEQLTLLTDGVVEARNKAGELFGFERTAAISTESAESIARAAQAHGQEDDITVLTLAFVGGEALHA